MTAYTDVTGHQVDLQFLLRRLEQQATVTAQTDTTTTTTTTGR